VLDFTQVFAGPFGSYQLALLGADVIKVERSAGDDMRRGPPNKDWAARNASTGWMAINANKRNIALDLTKPQSIEIVHRLAKTADVVWENYRPGVMDKLGIGYAALSKINPKLIYCAVSGFGQNGPERTTAAYDGKIQAMSGLMSITGTAQSGPTRAGFAVCDAIGGMTSAFAVASALFQRTHTGKGQLVDVSMYDSALTFMSSFVVDYTVGGHLQGPSGNRAQSRLPTADLFKCKGGYLLLAVNNEKQFTALARALEKPDLAKDPRFIDWPTRLENDAALRTIIEEVLAFDDAETWEQRFTDGDVPCAKVRTLAEAVAHPQLAHRDVLQTVDSPHGPLKLVANGFKLSHGSGRVDRAPVPPGHDADAILAEAGYSATDIAAMRSTGLI
jgi:crotonobetainyl-CoA:carnitine CoA-transferase CaiB-like acyl-CoA transferase